MGKKWLSLIIILTVIPWVSACNSSSNNDTAVNQTPPPPAPQPTQPAPQPEETQEAAKTENQDRVKVAGLIPPTNSDQRVQTIPRGVANPFNFLSPDPKVEIIQGDTSSGINDTLPLPEPPPQGTLPPDGNQETPETAEETTPNTELAKSITVTGVVTLGDTVQVLLRGPKDEFSRYVLVGDYVSGGEVLVKRVEEKDNRKFFVILEQSGVEIRKPIGITNTPVQSASTTS